ncbi:YdcF family protein [Spirulina sp. CCNP1310]|uniref:YdcF family protein n=1 Tax=Spirulina sp. CCNP1310 TaxID=3110249 RepID=UPI002B1F5586|nr:YdcF family protein [Spirulina sp. CCNP1310]MEA5418754.1 YdcF family protein [Spirulina sp. CCNP1310]
MVLKCSWQSLRYLLLGLLLTFSLALSLRLIQGANQPMDTVLVLGGSIRREMVAAQQAKVNPEQRILISSGSPPPCTFLVFAREGSLSDRIWLETCARSTFENFYYSTPILHRWGSRHVQLLTSPSHLPRALWLARIHLGIQGIWVSLKPVDETGVPGNQETLMKTILDVGRSLLWAVVSLGIKPECDRTLPLITIDLDAAIATGFHCEHQGEIEQFLEKYRHLP